MPMGVRTPDRINSIIAAPRQQHPGGVQMLHCDATQQDAIQVERHGRGRVNRQLVGDDPGDGVRIPHDVGRHENIDHRQHQGIDHVGHDQNPHGARTAKEDFYLLAQAVHGLASLKDIQCFSSVQAIWQMAWDR
jgi:hypothetical protein